MSNKDLFKEAIADAKAVREAALANAKAALEEALAPAIQNMISSKLQEIDEDLDEVEDLEEVDFISANDKSKNTDYVRSQYIKTGAMSESEEDLEEDFDLSEILAELSEENELEEAKDDDKKKENLYEDEDEDEESESGTVGDLTVDEFKDEIRDMIKDIISSEMGGGEMAAADNVADDAEEMAVDFSDETGGDDLRQDADDAMANAEEDEEINLEELLAELDSLDEADDTDEVYEAKKKKKAPQGEDKKAKEEMEEALNTINTLRTELNEVNLLNAKLLYVNKIFKSKNLNESQKLKVIAQFDKATTAKEAKVIYESMSSAIAKSAKSTIKESLGFASKAAGMAPQKPIVEVNDTVARWKMLAGITKF